MFERFFLTFTSYKQMQTGNYKNNANKLEIFCRIIIASVNNILSGSSFTTERTIKLEIFCIGHWTAPFVHYFIY